jgi:hypothetical protein
MTDIERFNLLWLCNAMTAPESAAALYYYDSRTKKFFVHKNSALSDMVDLPITGPANNDLLERLGDIDSEASEIVEIPRLNIQDKVAVQLLFLSKFPGVIHEDAIRLAAEKQKDRYGFALDAILGQMETLSPMEPYWEDFKLKTIQYYLEKYTGLVGITLKMI